MSKPESWKMWEGRSVGGKFPLRRWLGGSDHSAVFLTERPGVAKAAVKLIAVEAGNAEHELDRIRATTRLSHPHLIRTFEAGRGQLEGESFIYVVMEYAEEDLSQILPQRALAPDEVSDLLPPLLDAVSFLHGKGFVHKRIKPSNVLAAGNQLKLSVDQITPLSETNSVRRRDVYDAPETAAGIVSPASDVWSVGVTLIAAITQNVSLAEQASPKNPSLPESIAEPYRGIVRECLQLDPKRRCSVQEIQARLLPAARPAPPRQEPVPAKPALSQHDRYNWRMLIPVAVLLALVVGWLVFRGKPDQKAAGNPAVGGEQSQQVSQPPAIVNKPSAAPASPVREPSKSAEPARKATATNGDVRHQVMPDVSKNARNTIRGTIKVSVQVDVNPSGKVIAAKLKTAGPSRYFAEKALKAAEQWEFAPQPDTSSWLVHFHFRRSGIEASPEMLNR